MHYKYQAENGKLQHLVQHSWRDIGNEVCKLSRQLNHYNTMLSTMQHMKSTENWELLLNPFGQWDGTNKDCKWAIQGHTDSNLAVNPDGWKSVSGIQVFFNGLPVMAKSST